MIQIGEITAWGDALMVDDLASQDGTGRGSDRAGGRGRAKPGLGSEWSVAVSDALSALSDPRAEVPLGRRGRAEVQAALHILDDVLSRLG